MKLIAPVVLFCAFSQFAAAQTATTCQSIAKPSDRLACYDKATPPIRPAKATAAKPPAADQGSAIDQLAVENARLDAKIKTICRGC